MPRVMLNEVKHLKMSLREILPSLRFVRKYRISPNKFAVFLMFIDK